MGGMDAGAETSARLARRVHVVTRQPPALLAPGAHCWPLRVWLESHLLLLGGCFGEPCASFHPGGSVQGSQDHLNCSVAESLRGGALMTEVPGTLTGPLGQSPSSEHGSPQPAQVRQAGAPSFPGVPIRSHSSLLGFPGTRGAPSGQDHYVQQRQSLAVLHPRVSLCWVWWSIGSLHVGDLQAIVALQTALLGPALGVIVSAIFVLKRAIVIVEIGVFAAEAPSYLSQGQLRREE